MKNIVSLYQNRPILQNGSVMSYNFPPNVSNLVFWVEDFSVVIDGKFVDITGNNIILSAVTTDTQYDSIILPANNGLVISAVTNAGLYSTFYTDPNTPKIVKLSEITHCNQYNNHFFDEYNKKNWMLYKDELHDKDVDIIYGYVFGDPMNGGYVPIWGTTDATSFTLRGNGLITIDWNDGTSNNYTLTTSNQTISHTYSTKLGKQKNIRVTGKWYNVYQINTSTSLQIIGFRISLMKNLTTIVLYYNFSLCGDLTDKPLTYINLTTLYACNLKGDLSNKNFTYFRITTINGGRLNVTGYINTSSLTYIYILAPGPTVKLMFDITRSLGLYYIYCSSPYVDIVGYITSQKINYIYWINVTKNSFLKGDLSQSSGMTYMYINDQSYTNNNFKLTCDLTNFKALTSLLCVVSEVKFTGDISNCPFGSSFLYFLQYGSSDYNITGDITNKNITQIYFYNCLNASVYSNNYFSPSTNVFLFSNSPNLNIGGSIETISASATTISIDTSVLNKNFYYSGGTLPAWTSTAIRIENYLTTWEVDNFLINWSSTAGTASRTIYLAGNNQPRSNTTEVNNAIALLNSKGKTIITNV